MRANCLPEDDELYKGLTIRPDRVGQGRRAAQVALFSVELLVGYPVRDRRYSHKMLLGKDAVPLPHFPVRKVEVQGGMHGIWDVDPRSGLLFPEYRYPADLTVSYAVGYPNGEIPALIREAVVMLAREWLAGNDTDSEEVRGIIEACRWSRIRLKESIDGRQTD